MRDEAFASDPTLRGITRDEAYARDQTQMHDMKSDFVCVAKRSRAIKRSEKFRVTKRTHAITR
jgi:hypothetical protein